MVVSSWGSIIKGFEAIYGSSEWFSNQYKLL